MTLKYIIFPGYNDSLEECQAFINQCRKVGCKFIRLAVEYEWFNANKDNIPLHLYDLLDFFDAHDKEFKIEYIEDAINLKKLRPAALS